MTLTPLLRSTLRVTRAHRAVQVFTHNILPRLASRSLARSLGGVTVWGERSSFVAPMFSQAEPDEGQGLNFGGVRRGSVCFVVLKSLQGTAAATKLCFYC